MYMFKLYSVMLLVVSQTPRLLKQYERNPDIQSTKHQARKYIKHEEKVSCNMLFAVLDFIVEM